MIDQQESTVESTVAAYAKQLGWSRNELSRKADISTVTAQKALAGASNLADRTRRDICKALSEALGRQVLPGDITW